MTETTTITMPNLETAWQDVNSSFERFCLTAGISTLSRWMT